VQVTKFNLVTDLQIMLSRVPYSSFLFECNTERGCIDQLYIELGFKSLCQIVFAYLLFQKVKEAYVRHPTKGQLISKANFEVFI
jgi:hypothetical protein